MTTPAKSRPARELKKAGETLVFALAVLLLTFLAFMIVVLFQTSVTASGFATSTARLLMLAGIFTGVVFATGVLLQFPMLLLARRLGMSRVAATIIGACLGPAPIVVLVMIFPDFDQPGLVGSLIRFWRDQPGQALVELVPYVLAGAALGWFSWRPPKK